MIFLDTNIIIKILRQSSDYRKYIEFLADKEIALTAISIFELYIGALSSSHKEKNLQTINKLIKTLPIFHITSQSAIFAAKIYTDLEKKGIIIELPDILIGSIVLENQGTLLTTNLEHFQRITQLKIVNIP